MKPEQELQRGIGGAGIRVALAVTLWRGDGGTESQPWAVQDGSEQC